ncbi:MAG: HlyD family efflux transporter periplasmic adaptor subunit [Gammaproteobacteria bacterium]|nr:HlyD family efflux transporter periplasmic adaptor subunit [Gammaproteobacteria bacterium]
MLAGPASTCLAVTLAGGCLAALMAVAFLVEVPSKLNAPGVLLPVGGLSSVTAEESGVIGEVLVKPGVKVAVGSPLMTLLVDRMLTTGEGSFAIRAQSATRQRRMLEMRRRQERKAFESRLESFRLRKATLESSLVPLVERLRNSERQAELAAGAHRRLSSLAGTGHAALRDAESAEVRLLQAQAALSQLESERIETQSAIERVARDLEIEQAAFEALDLSLAMESARLADRTLELDSLARQSIVAPINGQLADVLARPGDTVSAGTILATLHRFETPIEARVYLSSQFAGRAEPGQEAVLKLPTFPSRQFGVLHGRLESITAAPLEPRDVRLVPNLFEPVYEARVTLERQYMDAKGRHWPLRPGLGVEATIVESRRTLIGWLLEPLRRGADASDSSSIR